MSFSSTPLGQGRRLDHHTFLNKPNARERPPHSPPRRPVPTSYAYGAPSRGTRSPPKPDNSALPLSEHLDDTDEPALVRFARLKQKEQLQSRTGTIGGPQQQQQHHHPEKWSVKDTSVNIASAFNQAVESTDDVMLPTNPNDAWATGARKQPLPRSTSVEYEKETQTTVNRRLAPPPPGRNNARVPRPTARTQSIRHVPDSEGEDIAEPSHENSRGKSPFEHVMDVSRRFIPTTFLMRPRQQEPETASQSVAPANGNSTVHEHSSYDYSAEERDFQTAQKTVPRRNTAVHKRNRMSTDNKAYRPTVSDLEESDEDFEDDDGKRARRNRKRNGAVGGPLTTLPVAGYDKRKKRRRPNGKTAGDDEEESSEEEEEENISEQRAQRGTSPLLQMHSLARNSRPPSRGSVSRNSIPPQGDSTHFESLMDVEQALDPIEELDEDLLLDGADPFPQRRSSFSIGAVLGKGVNGLFRLGWAVVQMLFGCLALIARLCGKILGLTIDIFVNRPVRWVSRADPAPLAKYAVIGLTIYSAWYALNHGWLDLGALSLGRSSRPRYEAPDIPISNSGELAERLHRLELALAQLSTDAERSHTVLEGSRSELVGRVGTLESQVRKESLRAQDAETKLRATTSDTLQAVRQEVNNLQMQIKVQRENDAHKGPVTGADDEARAKVRALEKQLGSMQGDVKEALELGKNAVTVAASVGSTAAWWRKLASGNAGPLTIRSADGQDVTALIERIVDIRVFKDALARPDHADYSAGAGIVPSLTSDTYELPSISWTRHIKRIFGHGGSAIGRPPVNALHYETHSGHCWPFAGASGQLGVALVAPTYISDIVIDHVPREVSADMRSAPRQMELWGLIEGAENVEKIKEWRAQRAARQEEARIQAELTGQPYVEDLEPTYPSSLPKSPEFFRVANFTYNIHAPHHIQTFPVSQEVQDLGIDFGIVVLLVKNNWGHPDYTCLYRLRVYGERMGGLPPPYPEEYAQS